MKKHILTHYLLLSVVLMSACQKDINEGSIKALEAKRAGKTKMQEARVFLTLSGFYKFRAESQHKTWQDVDIFYQKMVASNQENPHLDVLLQHTIPLLIDRDLHKSRSPEAHKRMEYYLEAYLAQSMQNPEYVYHLLSGLKGFWRDAKIRRVAQNVLQKNKTTYIKWTQDIEANKTKQLPAIVQHGDEMMSKMLKYQDRLGEF